MMIGPRSASKAARGLVRFARLTPRLLSLLVVSTLGVVSANATAAQPDDDERRTEVVYRHFV